MNGHKVERQINSRGARGGTRVFRGSFWRYTSLESRNNTTEEYSRGASAHVQNDP